MWLRAWFQETNSHPGPRCRDGNLLTDMRVSKSECDLSNDSQMNQVLLTNEHGDVFKRQISYDECDNEHHGESEGIPSSPIESEYFYEQFIDYPLNDSTAEQTTDLRQPNPNLSPFSRNMTVVRNDTLLNYDQHKLQQLHNKNNDGSTFTFFGMPLPSLSNLWSSGTTARKSNSRADVDANGKSRLRHFRPRPGEIVDGFQFSNNVQHVPPFKPTPPTIPTDKEPTNIQPPPPPPESPPNGYYTNIYSDPRVEKGGFIPMLPGHKGFTPIQNPFENETDSADTQETVSTELRPNVNLEYDGSIDDVSDNKYPVLVSTVNANPTTNRPHQSFTQPQFNVSSLKKGEFLAPTKSSNGISLIRSTTPPIVTSTIKISSTTQHTVTLPDGYQIIPEIDRQDNEQVKKNVQQVVGRKTPILPVTQKSDVANAPFYPTFMPNSSDVINLSKNRAAVNGSGNGVAAGSALSALVAPGAQQGIFRTPPLGRSSITKVIDKNTSVSTTFFPTAVPTQTSTQKPHSSTLKTVRPSTAKPSTTKPNVAQKLPTAEEFLRTTSQMNDNSVKENTTPNSHLNKTPQHTNDLDDQATQYKGDMNWYYSNYNRSTWKEPQLDPGLYRFRPNSASRCETTSYFTIIIFTWILATF